MSAALLLRLTVEDFLYREAALLDAWKLKEWLGLFAPDARYEVAPTGDAEAGTLSSAESLFLIADDRERLEQRVIRLEHDYGLPLPLVADHPSTKASTG